MVIRLNLVAALPLVFHGVCTVVRAMFIAGAFHGVEASALFEGSLLRLRSAVVAAVLSRTQPLAHGCTVLSLLDGSDACDPGFCIVWFRFRFMRRYLAYKSEQLGRICRIVAISSDGAPGHGPAHLLLHSAAEIGFASDSDVPCWSCLGLPCLSIVARLDAAFAECCGGSLQSDWTVA